MAAPLVIHIPQVQLWSPASPTLYDLSIRVGDDLVRSYVGVREVGRQRDARGHWRLTLNGQVTFHLGILDQGRWANGLLTPPSDALMRRDVQFARAAGFNTIRKHLKIEPRRFYTHCDRIGILVWQDHVSGGLSRSPNWTRLLPPVQVEGSPSSEQTERAAAGESNQPGWPAAAHAQFMRELRGMMDALHSHPSIVQWVPFNERWGQHATEEVGRWAVEHDRSRLVNVASGGNWLPVGHIVDHHQYPHPDFPFELGSNGRFDDFVKVVGEYGGHGLRVEGHVWDVRARNRGYGHNAQTADELFIRYAESIRRLAVLRERGIAAGIYTQASDVETEINGLLTYDRQVQKLAPARLRAIHEAHGFDALGKNHGVRAYTHGVPHGATSQLQPEKESIIRRITL